MRTTQMIGMSTELKDALGEFAQSNNRSVAEVCRVAVAAYIGYDLQGEEKPVSRQGRPRIYASKEERRKISRAKAREKRKLAKQLLEDFANQEARKAREEFAKAVNRS